MQNKKTQQRTRHPISNKRGLVSGNHNNNIYFVVIVLIEIYCCRCFCRFDISPRQMKKIECC